MSITIDSRKDKDITIIHVNTEKTSVQELVLTLREMYRKSPTKNIVWYFEKKFPSFSENNLRYLAETASMLNGVYGNQSRKKGKTAFVAFDAQEALQTLSIFAKYLDVGVEVKVFKKIEEAFQWMDFVDKKEEGG